MKQLNYKKDSKRGVTLVETVIAVSLAVGIIGAALFVDFINQQWHVVTNAEAELVRELSLVVADITKSIRIADSVTVDMDNDQIQITVSGDTGRYEWVSPEVRYYPPGSVTYEVAAIHISLFEIVHPTPDPLTNRVPYFQVRLTASNQWGGVMSKQVTVVDTIGSRDYTGVTIQAA